MENFGTQKEAVNPDAEKFQKEFARLQDVARVLRELGLRVIDRAITPERLNDPATAMGFPIVRDGGDGIRASYSRREGLRIWFANVFSDPANLRRQEVESALRGSGLL